MYDLVGKIQQVNDPTGTCSFAYDNMGRLLGTTTQYSFLPGRTFSNSYAYDAASNRTSFTAPDNSTVSYVYDTLNRLQTLTSSFAGQFGFGYDALSRRTSLTRPNGVSTSYNYDSVSRLLSVLHQAGGVTIDGAGYTLDAAGNRTSKQNLLNGVTDSYTYDLIYQLTQVTQGATTESYSYDAVGNRLSSLGLSSYQYNNSNQLTSTPNATFTFDNNGNTLTKTDSNGVTGYTWDYENRLTSVTLPGGGGTVIFKYDPFGRRIQKVSGVGTTIFAYDGGNVVDEVNAAGAVTAQFAQGAGIDEPLAAILSGTLAFYEADGLGSVTSMTNTSGSAVGAYIRDSFGKAVSTADTLGNRFRYTAREWDEETGMYYYRARYYDPQIGRFISEDPVKFTGGVNFYSYVRNNPIMRIDPSGLTSIAYVVSTGQLVIDPEQPGRAPYVIPSTSGRGGCMNNSSDPCQRAKNEGPIPPGIYNLRASEITQPGFFGHIRRRMTGDWGDWRAPLHPSPTTNTLGRDGFFLHGGGSAGSAGCIDFGGGLFGNDTTNALLQDLRNDPDGNIPVVVFPTPPDIRIPMIPLP